MGGKKGGHFGQILAKERTMKTWEIGYRVHYRDGQVEHLDPGEVRQYRWKMTQGTINPPARGVRAAAMAVMTATARCEAVTGADKKTATGNSNWIGISLAVTGGIAGMITVDALSRCIA